MSQINALQVIHAVHRRMVDFALTDHYVRDAQLRAACEAVWGGDLRQGGLGSDLWVEGAFPSKTSEMTLADLVAQAMINPQLAAQLDRTGAFPKNRRPYTHQRESIEAAARGYAAADKPAIVVTAGTGAGKTESFLLPLLSDVCRHEPEPGEGVSCLILYPMNALVNDQVDRLYSWLKGQEQTTFFHFTSETPENAKVAASRGVPIWERCRFRTRRQARGLEDATGKATPGRQRGPVPKIVVTNYSMLEYMLCRPQDAVFFGRNLRTVVLDEAHLYTGNLAAEIALLLRRLYLKCGLTANDVVQFATSATIGSGGTETEQELRGFAAELFGKPTSGVQVIQGVAHRETFVAKGDAAEPASILRAPWPDTGTLEMVDGEPRFRTCSAEEFARWRQALASLVPAAILRDEFAADAPRFIAPILARVLKQSPTISRLYEVVWKLKRAQLPDVAKALFGRSDADAVEATRCLLQVAACARTEPAAYPLLPNRVHFLVRSPEGLSFSFYAKDAPRPEVRYGDLGFVFSSGSGPGEDRPLGATLSLARCQLSGEWFLAGVEENGHLREVPLALAMRGEPESGWLTRLRFFSPRPIAQATQIVFNPQNGAMSGLGSPGIPLWRVTECPATGLAIGRSIRFFGSQSGLQLTLLAETALMEMPVYAHEDRRWKPARGRRLLIFSDSRTEAARLGPRFTRQHEVQVFRAAVASTLATGDVAGPEMVAFLEQQATFFRQQIAAATPGSAIQAQAQRGLEDCEQKLAQTRGGGALPFWEEKIARDLRMHELLDLDFGLRHRAADWGQTSWDKNRDIVVRGVRRLLAREFMRRTQWPDVSLETAGLVEVVYPGLELLPFPTGIDALLPSEQCAQGFREIWIDYLAGLLDTIRTDGAVTLGSREEDLTYEYGGALVGRFLSERGREESLVLPMISVTGRSARHRFTRDLLTRLGADIPTLDALAENVLAAVFRALHEATVELPWLKREVREVDGAAVDAFQITFPQLALRVPAQTFRCANSGQIWPRSVLGLFPGIPRAELESVAAAELDRDSRVGRQRIEWRTGEIFRQGLWAEEHSAQLSPQENGRIQELFKAGIRNILSSTTTLELGIDIGGLSGVLMGNIPPGKANYLQRAGRAGRRADGSSVVLGYARSTPYERQVFARFGEYLGQSLRKPLVFLDRREIVFRHLSAMLLGDFFHRIYRAGETTGAMDAFGTVGKFYRQPMVGYWEKSTVKPLLVPCPGSWSVPHEPWVPPGAGEMSLAELFAHFLAAARDEKNDLSIRARTLVTGTPMAAEARESWPVLVDEIIRAFRQALQQWCDDYQELLERWNGIDGGEEGESRSAANAIYHQMRTYYELTVIETLADSLFLPRYGFPIGLSRLRVAVPDAKRQDKVREEDQFRLQRSSMLALREYAPGSEVLVGNRVVTSRGLLKHWTGNDVTRANMGLRGWFVRDPATGHFLYSLVGIPKAPEHLNSLLLEQGQMLFARHGFTSAAWDPPRFGAESGRVGTVSCYTTAFANEGPPVERRSDFGGVSELAVWYRAAGEILLLNEGEHQCGFCVCLKCGYADSERTPGSQLALDLPAHFHSHASLFSARDRGRCWHEDEAPVLRNQRLAARQISNLVMLDLSRWLANTSVDNQAVAFTVGQALRLVGCRALQIDSREVAILDQFASPHQAVGAAVVLYDAVAGGSGHVREMMHQGRQWLENALEYLNARTDSGEFDEREATQRLLTADIVRPDGTTPLRPRAARDLFRCLLEGEESPRVDESSVPTLDVRGMIDRALARNTTRGRQSERQ